MFPGHLISVGFRPSLPLEDYEIYKIFSQRFFSATRATKKQKKKNLCFPAKCEQPPGERSMAYLTDFREFSHKHSGREKCRYMSVCVCEYVCGKARLPNSEQSV